MNEILDATTDDLALLCPVLEAVPYSMLAVDAEGRICCLNQPARSLLGHGPEIIGQQVEVLIPPALAQRHREHRNEYAKAPRQRPMGSGLELWARRADNTRVRVEVSLSPTRVGTRQYVIASIRDVGPQRRAKDIQVRLHQQETLMSLWEQALRTGTGEHCMQNAVSALHELFSAHRVRLFEIDTDLSPVRVRTLCDTGVAGDANWAPIDSVPEVRAIYSEELRAAEHRLPPVAAKMHQQDGEALLVLSLRSQGVVVGALSISLSQGVTFTRDQVYLAQNVSHLLASVLARRRSDELLLTAAKMEALGQLSGGIAHDFNNLLSIIAGNLEILGDRMEADAVSRTFVDVALGATRRGGELTKRLLLFARKRPPQLRAHDVAPLVKALADVLKGAVGDRIDLRVDVPPDLPPAEVDPSVFDACLINLATNARDAMPEGGTMTVHIHADELDTAPPDLVSAGFQPGRYVIVEVRDSGEGMSEETRQRAFDPFFSTKSSGQGTGLGLSLIRSLVTQAGGHVALCSKPGGGTRVALYLPVASGEPEAEPLIPPSETEGHGECVLIVEDEPAVRDTVHMMVEDLGYTAIVAESFTAAQEQLARHPEIAVVFTDIALGRHGSGLELRQELAQSRPELPVVLTSGYARPMLERYGLDKGAVTVLGKPYTRAQLGASLRKALDQAAGR